MGVDPAPQMANLYLYYYEAAFMEKLTKLLLEDQISLEDQLLCWKIDCFIGGNCIIGRSIVMLEDQGYFQKML